MILVSVRIHPVMFTAHRIAKIPQTVTQIVPHKKHILQEKRATPASLIHVQKSPTENVPDSYINIGSFPLVNSNGSQQNEEEEEKYTPKVCNVAAATSSKTNKSKRIWDERYMCCFVGLQCLKLPNILNLNTRMKP